MIKRRRYGLVTAGLAIALAGAGVGGASSTHTFAVGGGVAVGSGVTKHFAFAAHQRSSSTLDASGYAVVTQDDPTNVFGDFRLQGPVKCVRVVGDHAVIGITIQKGSGTAAGREGEAFYLIGDDNTPVSDSFDNSGYTGTTSVDCNYDQSPGQVVVKGNILVRP